MSAPASVPAPDPETRRLQISDRLGDIMGHVNALMGEASVLAAEMFNDDLLGGMGVRSLSHYLEWKCGLAPGQARQLATIAKRRAQLPETIGLLDQGLLTVDQVGPIAARLPADADADAEFAELAQWMTVSQIRKAVRATVPPDTAPNDPERTERDDAGDVREFSFGNRDDGTWTAFVRATAAAGGLFEAALRSHYDALMNEWKALVNQLDEGEVRPPRPTWFDALERIFDRSLEREAADRPHSQRTKVLVHLNAETGLAQLHLGPALSVAERAMLCCDATIATVVEANGTPVSVGRAHRIVPDKTRILIEQRDQGCAIPSCPGRYVVIHHIIHWEHGGPTDTWNLVCLCPAHHRATHRGDFHIEGNADEPGGLVITDRNRRRRLTGKSAALPPPQPMALGPNRYQHPWGAAISWRDFTPPHIPTSTDIPDPVGAAA